MEYRAQIAEEKGMTLQTLQKEMQEEAKEFAEFTGKKVKVPDAGQIVKKLERQKTPLKLAKVSVPVPLETKALVARYMREERELTKRYKAEIKATKSEFKAKLRQIQGEMKSNSEKSPEDFSKSLEGAKNIYRAKLKMIGRNSGKEFDSLRKEYQRRDEFFEYALQKHLRLRGIFRTAGKIIITALIMSLLVITIHITVGLIFSSIAGKVMSGFGSEGETASEPPAEVMSSYEMPDNTRAIWEVYNNASTSQVLKDNILTIFQESNWIPTEDGLLATSSSPQPDLSGNSISTIITSLYQKGDLSASEAFESMKEIGIADFKEPLGRAALNKFIAQPEIPQEKMEAELSELTLNHAEISEIFEHLSKSTGRRLYY